MTVQFTKSRVYLSTLCFLTLAAFSSDARAQGTHNSVSGEGKVTICKEIDDDWKCVGESNEWKANVPFNILFENPVAAGVDFIGMVFYKQGASGKDVEFVNEYQ